MTSGEDGNPVICSSPIDAAVLADYWLGVLPESEEAAVEEHLLACDACGQRLREVIALAEAIRNLAGDGSLRMVVSDAFLKRAEEVGLRIRKYTLPAGGSVQCTVTAEDDLLIGQLAAKLSGAKRVDLCICDGSGVEQARLKDIPVNSETGSINLHESITAAKAAPSYKMIARLMALDESGGERLLGEYTFNHTRTLPGPGEQ